MIFPWSKPEGPDIECPECSGTRFVAVSQAVTLKLWQGKAVMVPACTDLVCRSCSCPVEFSRLGVKSLRKKASRPLNDKPEEPAEPQELDSDLAMTRAERRRRERK